MNGRVSRLTSVVVLASLALLASGCRKLSLGPSQNHAAEIERITQIDIEWVKAAQTRSVDAWMSFYAPDAVVLPPNEKTADTPAAIRSSIGELLGLKDLAIDWKATKVSVSDAGDMAWLYGTYTLQGKDPMSGTLIADNGKIAEIWHLQSDGSWKCVLDTWSSDLPVLIPDKK